MCPFTAIRVSLKGFPNVVKSEEILVCDRATAPVSLICIFHLGQLGAYLSEPFLTVATVCYKRADNSKVVWNRHILNQ